MARATPPRRPRQPRDGRGDGEGTIPAGSPTSSTGSVLIVGAGPAGALLAQLLASRGLDVCLLERSTDFAREFRGEVLMPSGLEALDQAGLWPEVEAVPQVELQALELYVDGRLQLRQALPEPAFGRFRPRWISQPALLERLVARARTAPGFRFHRGTTVRSLLEDGGRVCGVHALGPEGELELRADLVVGADGRSSTVRRRAGLAACAARLPMDVVWFHLPLPERFAGEPALRAYLGGGHLLIAAPVPERRLQIGWIIAKGSYGDLRSRPLSEWIDAMAAHVSPDLAAHLRERREEATLPFLLSTVSDRVRRWSRPGVLVIGDAAHTMSPVGAQGLNLALRDAIEAANELVPALRAGPDAARIDLACRRVEALRRPEVRTIQRLQALPPPILLRASPWARWLVRRIPALLGSDVARARGGTIFRRFAFGVTEVRLRA